MSRCMYMCRNGGWCEAVWVIDYNHRRTGAATDPQSLGTPGWRSTLFRLPEESRTERREGKKSSLARENIYAVELSRENPSGRRGEIVGSLFLYLSVSLSFLRARSRNLLVSYRSSSLLM